MKDNALFFYQTTRDFLTVYLIKQRGVSPNTVKSYREALNLLIEYVRETKNSPLKDISFQCISRELIESFLQWLETERKCTISTRNQRMSAMKSFLKYAAEKDKLLMALYLDVNGIPKKKDTKVHTIDFFSEAALEVILAQPDKRKRNGQRDLFFLILMYDTGARAQEMLDLKVCDICMDRNNPYIVITGKGSKTRHVPIMQKTCRHFESYRHRFHPTEKADEYLFYIDRKGNRTKMSIDNVEKFVARYGEKAHSESQEVPEHLYPHMLRHSRSMHLYRNGMPLPLVAEWLGHAKMETTRRFYANADTSMKKEAIDKATSDINPLYSNKYDIEWEDDDELLKQLYCLK
ncbi:MAG: site-specific integrase [Lachnospiraceae bacterium]|nr:site-specific integrase [Lachnospiraceae bacterium]